MFDTRNKPVTLESIYGEHEFSAPNFETNDTIRQKEMLANYTRDFAQAKEGFLIDLFDLI